MTYISIMRRAATSPRALSRTAAAKAFGVVLGVAAVAVAAGSVGQSATAADTAAPSAHDAALEAQFAASARRQGVLERIVTSQAGELSADEATARQVAATADKALAQAGAMLPKAAALAMIERRQLAAAEALAASTEARATRTEQAIRRVGLNPRLLLAKLADRSAQGGPLVALADGGQPLDPRFARLGASVTRLSALQRAADAIPSHLPASLAFISSPFGVRSDPITGEPAVHAGLDFRGPIGAPIHAAASGTVTFAGDKGGYGNCIEITHGNGMVTRYAHMSAFKARVGQEVAAGDVVGAIGNTGRSTGPHLHFEVRINGQAVNPRPFLDTGASSQG